MTSKRNIIRALAVGLTGLLITALPALADDQDAKIEDFFGAYIGDAMIEGTMQFRDIIVSIEPIRNGFSIYTSTVIRTGPKRATRDVKWRAETQNFVRSDMPHVYQPLVRKSMFSEKRDPDLMAGDTLAWASIRGHTLGVYAMNVLEDGHYELRVFERTLTDLGMDISFVRYSDGIPVRELKGNLARTKSDDDTN
jgi:hypothetical protein